MKHEDSVRGALFNHDETLILSWSEDNTVRLWNARDGSLAAEPMKHEDSVRGALFNHDETLILSWSEDTLGGSRGEVRLWNARDGSLAAEPMKHDYSVNGALFDKDETLILSWSEDNTVRLWNAKDGSLAAEPMKHEDCVLGALFNKDETLILSWSEDNTVRLWNIAADYDFPNEHLTLMINVMTGTQMDDYGNVAALSEEEWKLQKKEYIKIAKEHEKECKYKKANLYLRQKEYWGDN
jgi:WD40 repeat protein